MQLGTRKLVADYDSSSDTLFLSNKNEKAARSLIIGDVIVDYAKDNTVVGMEFLNATETIKPLLIACPNVFLEGKDRLKSSVLEEISKANAATFTSANMIILAFVLQFNKVALEGKLSVPMPTIEQRYAARNLAVT